MKPQEIIYFATGNQEKIQLAESAIKGSDITIKPANLEIEEIQGEDPEVIVRAKAEAAYKILETPVIVSDDSWSIRALNGFPGPYMKSINYWFTAKDFLRLMEGIEDRHIEINQFLAYTDGNVIKVFRQDIPGNIIHTPRGVNSRSPNMEVIELDSDNGKTIAEVFEGGNEEIAKRFENIPNIWNKFIAWHTKERI